ncbi:MAG: hypothetical protein ACFFAO_02295 [Candidatus Hermodarchaeota archaeon]
MRPKLIPNKKVFLGGNNSYYITKDKRYFVKVNKGRREWIIKEFNNLKKYWNKLDVGKIQLIEPVYFSEKNEFLVTKYLNSKKLVEILDPYVYYEFGKNLKLFHEKGFRHSHLEVHDILYYDNKYYLADVPFFNERPIIHDLVSIKLSLNLYKLKRPWNLYKYKRCYEEFLKGYGTLSYKKLEKEYHVSIKKRIRLYLKHGSINKFKAYIIKLIYKIRLL